MNQPHHFIVVDDDTTNNLICEYTIRSFNREANIQLFTDPDIALAALSKSYRNLKKSLPTILLLDINMPTMTGWEFLELLKNLDEKVQQNFTIFMLSSSIEDFSEKAQSYPQVSGFFSKPLKINYLEGINVLWLKKKVNIR